jgi:hypothetical protein
MNDPLLFILFVAAVAGAAYAVWRFWNGFSDRTPEDTAYERRVSALNERQANRYSDEDLKRTRRPDDAWQITVERGRRAGRRQDRYAGDAKRRLEERRRR